MTRYRAVVYVDGAEPEKVYADDLEAVKRRAVRKLTYWKPGEGSLQPSHVSVQVHTGTINGNTARWDTLTTLFYRDVPEDQQEWRRRRAKQDAAKQDAAKPAESPEIVIAPTRPYTVEDLLIEAYTEINKAIVQTDGGRLCSTPHWSTLQDCRRAIRRAVEKVRGGGEPA